MTDLTRAWYGDEAATLLRQIPMAPDLKQAAYPSHMLHPERTAELYRNATEEIYRTSSRAREQMLIQAIARLSTPTLPSNADLRSTAEAIAANREPFGQRQILVDISMLAQSDTRSGAQHVTRAILLALISDPPPGY